MADIKLGSNAIDNFKVGSNQVDKVYLGSTLLWQNRAQINLTISSNATSYELKSAVDATGQYVSGKSDIIVTIQSGVYVGGGTASYAMYIRNFASGDTIKFVNYGVIIGRAGNGGSGGYTGGGGNGGNGYHGLYIRNNVSIDNQGQIAAGAGGGGGGGGYRYCTNEDKNGDCTNYDYYQGGGGGGGRGYNGGSGGAGGNAPGGDGSKTSYGSGSAGTGSKAAGGRGGVLGGNGVNGESSTYGGGSGGTRGYYVNGYSYITWINAGNRYGRTVN